MTVGMGGRLFECETKLPILKMTECLSWTCGMATTPSGTTVTNTEIWPWAKVQKFNNLIAQKKSMQK